MTVTTKAVWVTPIAPSTIEASQVQVDTMIQEGKTDGIPVITYDSPIAGQETVDRTWVDLAAAQQWLDFLAPYGPVSTEIVA